MNPWPVAWFEHDGKAHQRFWNAVWPRDAQNATPRHGAGPEAADDCRCKWCGRSTDGDARGGKPMAGTACRAAA